MCFVISKRDNRFEKRCARIRSFLRRTCNHCISLHSFLHTHNFSRYERLVLGVIIPYLKTQLDDPETPRVFHYQYPCTLRLQPGPSKAYNRVHRDAEYGHQIGEINFWMPLSDYALTHTQLSKSRRLRFQQFQAFGYFNR